ERDAVGSRPDACYTSRFPRRRPYACDRNRDGGTVSKLRNKLFRRHKKSKKLTLTATAREIGQIGVAIVRDGIVGVPVAFGRSLVMDSGFAGVFSEDRFFEVLGRQVLTLFNNLGPIYGKAGQVFLSRLSP